MKPHLVYFLFRPTLWVLSWVLLEGVQAAGWGGRRRGWGGRGRAGSRGRGGGSERCAGGRGPGSLLGREGGREGEVKIASLHNQHINIINTVFVIFWHFLFKKKKISCYLEFTQNFCVKYIYNIHDGHESGKKSDFLKTSTSYVTDLTFFFVCLSPALSKNQNRTTERPAVEQRQDQHKVRHVWSVGIF